MIAFPVAATSHAVKFTPSFHEPVSPGPGNHVHTAVRGISLYRLPQVLARIPISRSAWYAGIKAGMYPQSFSLGPRTAVWRSDEIDLVVISLINRGSQS